MGKPQATRGIDGPLFSYDCRHRARRRGKILLTKTLIRVSGGVLRAKARSKRGAFLATGPE